MTAGSSARRLGLQPVRLRSSQILAASSAGTWRGELRGRLERSAKQTSESRSASVAVFQRWTHVQTVDFDTPAQAAACANVSPSSTTLRTTTERPNGVWLALWCGTPGLLET